MIMNKNQCLFGTNLTVSPGKDALFFLILDLELGSLLSSGLTCPLSLMEQLLCCWMECQLSLDHLVGFTSRFHRQIFTLFQDEEDADDIQKGFTIEMVSGKIKLFVTDGFGVNFEYTIEKLDSEHLKR